MRKIKTNTKILMAIFALFVASTSIIFVIIGQRVKAVEQEKVVVSSEEIVFVDNTKIAFESTVEIKKNFEGVWIAATKEGNKTSLGKNVVIIKGQTIEILGGGYQVFEDQTVAKLPDIYTVEDINAESFYKLNDRRYLFVNSQIKFLDSDDTTFENYVYIVLDKAGNGQLFGKEEMIKTTKEVTLIGLKNQFNISREVLYIDELQVDLKRVYGTTSTYLSNYTNDNDILNYDEEYDNPEVIDLTIKGGNGGNGGKGGLGGDGGAGGTGGTGAAGGGGSTSTGGGNIQEARKSMQFNTVESYFDKMDIKYTIVDPLAQLGVTWLRVYDLTDEAIPKLVQEINIDPMGTDVQVFDLKPGVRYQLVLGYIARETDEGDGFIQQDSMKISTNAPAASISLVEQSDTKVIFNVKVDSNYRPDQLKIGLINAKDESSITQVDVDLNIASESRGQLISIDFSDKNIELLQIKVISAKKNGIEINFNGYATFYNRLYK